MLWFEMRSWASLANTWQQKASRRRRQLTRAARQLGSVSERLEDRKFLSAISVSNSGPETRDVSLISPDSLTEPHSELAFDSESLATVSEPQHGKKFKLNLTGDWTIDTSAGKLDINTVQRGKRIRGTADLNLASLLNLPIPLPVEIDVPPVVFKGKFKKGILNVDFRTQVDVPILGSFEVTGNITAQVQLGSGIVGHLIVNVNGNQVLSTDFTSPLPTLPLGG